MYRVSDAVRGSPLQKTIGEDMMIRVCMACW